MASFGPWNRSSIRLRSTDTPCGRFASLLVRLLGRHFEPDPGDEHGGRLARKREAENLGKRTAGARHPRGPGRGPRPARRSCGGVPANANPASSKRENRR